MAMFVIQAVSCQLSLQRHRFSTMVFQVGFEVKKVALGQASLRVFQFHLARQHLVIYHQRLAQQITVPRYWSHLPLQPKLNRC